MSEEKMKFCINCKFYRERNFEQMMKMWVLPGQKLTKVTHEDMCAHPDYLSLVDGSPEYSCKVMRDNNSKCGKEGKCFEEKNDV